MREKLSIRAFWSFVFFSVIRFVSVFPLIIDDDEAWWSASAAKLSVPWRFYLESIDDKPPGTVWFYWIWKGIFPAGALPQVTRASYVFVTILAAYLLGKIAERQVDPKLTPFENRRFIKWFTASLFLLVTATASPKLLAVTGDGLIVCNVIIAYYLVMVSRWRGAVFLGGIFLGLGILVKQTAVFFGIPILLLVLTKTIQWKKLFQFAAGSLVVILPSILALGLDDFFYWNWTYPKEILVGVREQLFDSQIEFLTSFGLFILTALPVFVLAIKNLRLYGDRRLHFPILLSLSGFLAVLLGKGLFVHYYLLIIPGIILLSIGFQFSHPLKGTRSLAFLYLANCLLLAIPGSGIFWGSDLFYYNHLNSLTSRYLNPKDTIMVWGGSAIPLAYGNTTYATRFVIPRFAVPPYESSRAKSLFYGDLKLERPRLILDLHERGDNRFREPPESVPEFAAILVRDYELFISPALPWVKFYFRKDALPEADSLALVRANRSFDGSRYPEDRKSWEKLFPILKPPYAANSLQAAIQWDWYLRADATLELFELNAPNDNFRAEARILRHRLIREEVVDLREPVEKFIDQYVIQTGMVPLPWQSPLWWPEVALVELQ